MSVPKKEILENQIQCLQEVGEICIKELVYPMSATKGAYSIINEKIKQLKKELSIIENTIV